MKFAIKKQAEKQTLENTHRFKQELESEKQCHMTLYTQYKEWQLKEQERISKLKINVLEALQETYERLSRLKNKRCRELASQWMLIAALMGQRLSLACNWN